MSIQKIYYKVSHPTDSHSMVPATLTETLAFLFSSPSSYFHVLSAIKHSAFFTPSYPNLPPRPSYVLLRGGKEWEIRLEFLASFSDIHLVGVCLTPFPPHCDVLLKIPMDPVALTEALPFLVCTVGFDKLLHPARAVFSHPQMDPPSSSVGVGETTNGNGMMKPTGETVLEALSNIYTPIFRDYVLEIAVLLGGAWSRVSGLREACTLAASDVYNPSKAARLPLPTHPLLPLKVEALDERFSSLVPGEKGSSLPSGNKNKSMGTGAVENLVGRLKPPSSVNFITPLMLQSLLPSASHSSLSLPSTSLQKVDPSTPAIQHVLAALADTECISATEGTEKEVRESGLVVKINPAIHLPASSSQSQSSSLSSSELVKNFMSSWSCLFEWVSVETSASGKAREQQGVIGDKVEEPVRPVQLAPAPASAPASMPISVLRRPPTFTLDEINCNIDDLDVRPLEKLTPIYDNGPRPTSLTLSLNDEEVILLAQNDKIAAVRRALISRASKMQTLEHSLNVVGYIPLPLDIAGPLKVDGHLFSIPIATAEGTLIASTSRGVKPLMQAEVLITVLTQDAMTRGPAIDFPSVVEAAKCKAWIESAEGYGVIKEAIESTSRFAKLRSLKYAMAGRTLFVRFATATGDAMGMNMISKGTEKALEPAAINWIEGRGKSVVAEAVVPGKIVKSVLKTTVEALVNLNTKKNLVGSVMAGSIAGFNAHAANILTAVFLATGQDPAQNTRFDSYLRRLSLRSRMNNGQDLLITITMPSIEVGTVGGGTLLTPQQAILEMLGFKGAHPTHPGKNAQSLARMIAAAVMAGELSLMSALAAGHLVRAHLVHNRSQVGTPAVGTPNPGAMLGSGSVLGGGLGSGIKKLGQLSAGMTMSSLTPSASTGSLPPYKP
ncbi:hypothetical protein BT96DRAFT_1007073 [Gymnopus androsaceus JB14]|uniref:hydroxymethylglutaryl-CoA reductase (NADPH) n=1 Tax=Gymnopus androsaceus JB14 TaxID=1447944 RepID=A0A6A4GJB9_9AGAR|nr:hypothetical protein BT96DRAFT_1007073 [Gymnopus androsaceus JB14]